MLVVNEVLLFWKKTGIPTQDVLKCNRKIKNSILSAKYLLKIRTKCLRYFDNEKIFRSWTNNLFNVLDQERRKNNKKLKQKIFANAEKKSEQYMWKNIKRLKKFHKVSNLNTYEILL